MLGGREGAAAAPTKAAAAAAGLRRARAAQRAARRGAPGAAAGGEVEHRLRRHGRRHPVLKLRDERPDRERPPAPAAPAIEFDVGFGAALPALRADLPPPTGGGQGPTPEQLLAAAVGNCLSASLLFALRKFKQSPDPISTDVEAEIGRNAEGRMRVLGLRARIALGVPAARLENLQRVLDSFETYCTVTQSVRAAIPVDGRGRRQPGRAPQVGAAAGRRRGGWRRPSRRSRARRRASAAG